MSFYARLINTERWRNFASCNSLPGEAITLDWECKNNEWSVFKCDSFSSGKNDLMDKIALYLVAKSPQKTESGVDLLVIDDVFIKKVGVKVYSDPPQLDCIHCNLRDIDYLKIKRAVDFTFKKYKDQIVSYSIRDIRNLFEIYAIKDPQYMKEYIKENRKKIQRLESAYFKDIPKFFDKFNDL